MHIRLLATVGLLFLTGSFAEAQEKYSLRTKHELGKKLEYQLSLETLSKLKTLGDEAQRSKVVLQSQVETTAAPTGNQKLVNWNFLSFKGQVNLYGQTLNLDSENLAEVPPILQQLYGGLLHRNVGFIYDAEDRFVSHQTPQHDHAPPLGQGSGLLSKQLADLQRFSAEVSVPPNEVAVGETWDVKQTLDGAMLGQMQVNGKATFVEIVQHDGEAMAKIEAKLQLSLESSSSENVPLMTLDTTASQMIVEVLFRLSDHVPFRQSSQSTVVAQFNGNGAVIEQKSVNQWIKTSSSKP